MNKESIKKRLQNLKELAERGVGGEQENAMKMYEEIKLKYNFTDDEIIEEEIETEWFRFKDSFERRLLKQICFMVTGCQEFYTRVNKKFKLLGHDCTKFEKDEIEFMFTYYKAHFQKELDTFYSAFCSVNHLYPSPEARCYEEPVAEIGKIDASEKKKSMKVGLMASGMETCPRPNKQIGTGKND